MEATVLNANFEAVAVIDEYKSFIWTERFNECGDFELYIPIVGVIPDYIKKNYYLWKSGSRRLMIIESLSVDNDDEEGAFLVVTGRSLESILTRRIVWNKRVFFMSDDAVMPKLQDVVEKLLKENVYETGSVTRNINNFVFVKSEDPKITDIEIEAEYLGQDLYEIVSKLCKEHEIGFKMEYYEAYTKDDITYTNAFVFSLVAGVDRSYEQSENPYVIFSPEFDNIISSSYVDSDETLKNVALIVGETQINKDGEEESRRQYVLTIKNIPHFGLDRREVFVDATSLSTDDGYGGTIKNERYQAMLKQKGIDSLMENTSLKAFEGEVESSDTYVYRRDYDMGDIVQLVNEYGHEGQAYISEYIESCDDSGYSAYPTFKAIQKGEYEAE